jgi:hypothetical protein
MWTLQIIEYYQHQPKARTVLRGISEYTGFLGGAVGERPNGEGYYVQAFFRAGEPYPIVEDVKAKMDNLPDGAKYVYVPHLLQKWYGFTEAN